MGPKGPTKNQHCMSLYFEKIYIFSVQILSFPDNFCKPQLLFVLRQQVYIFILLFLVVVAAYVSDIDYFKLLQGLAQCSKSYFKKYAKQIFFREIKNSPVWTHDETGAEPPPRGPGGLSCARSAFDSNTFNDLTRNSSASSHGHFWKETRLLL